MDYRIFELKAEISQNLKLKWTTEEMAKRCEVSKDHFHKLFKSVTNQTPIQYVKEQRLEESKKLLETTKKRVKEIIYLVGINDQTHFVRDFKKAYGKKPNEYRQHFREEKQTEKLNNPKEVGNG